MIRPQAGPQTRFLSTKADIALGGGSAGGGKAADINTPVPTPDGFKRLGEIKPGDKVFAIDGSIATVVNAFPIEYREEAFDVVFDSGEVITVDGEHLWKTMDSNERTRAHHLTEEFRSARREKRQSRAKEVKNISWSNSITERNKIRTYEYLVPTDGSIRNTYEIKDSLFFRKTRINHSVELAKPIQTPENDMLVESYLFGCWLGDGFSGTGKIGCLVEDMDEILTHIKSEVLNFFIETERRKQPFKVVTFKGFTQYIRKFGLKNNKHIPIEYLRGSIEQRIELLKGLMDTDGTCSKENGKCTIAFSNKRLIEDTKQLICSLGIKCTVREKKIKGYNSSYIINFTPNFHVFHLERKKVLQRFRTVRAERRYILDVREAKPCFMRCIQIDHPSRLYLIGETFIPTHNTFSLLLEAARYIGNPEYGAVIFRREMKMITSEGGLRDTAMTLYPHLGAQYRSQPSPHFIFPSGARVTFAHLNQESECLNWQGSQIAFIGFDELTHFTQFQAFYMMSRLRSTSGVRPYMRWTTNPDSDSWVAEFIEWYIDQDTGFPIPERSGVLRYFARKTSNKESGNIVWGNSREETAFLAGCNPEDCKSFTFVPSKITDNPFLLKKDPGYLANLKGLPKVEKARLLDGNWKIRAEAGMYFARDEAVIIDWLPTDVVKWVRSWDLAASEESESRNPDWTVGMLVGRRASGTVVIGDVIRVRRKANAVRNLLLATAAKDGKEVWIVIPQDPGQSGKDQLEGYRSLLNGYTLLSRTITKNKVVMAANGPESAAALWQRGQIEIVRGNWNKDLLDELDAFPTPKIHDDQVDALSGAIHRLPGKAPPDYSKGGLGGRFRTVEAKNRYRK